VAVIQRESGFREGQVPTRYVAGRLGCRMTAVDITQRSVDFAKKVAALEREKMDIHFAQGKMELGRFVCLKPACPGPEVAAPAQAGVSGSSVRRSRNERERT
jgi:hypothetical protein